MKQLLNDYQALCLYAYDSSCTNCEEEKKRFATTVSSLSNAEDVFFSTVNCGASKAFCDELHVSSLPSIVFVTEDTLNKYHDDINSPRFNVWLESRIAESIDDETASLKRIAVVLVSLIVVIVIAILFVVYKIYKVQTMDEDVEAEERSSLLHS